MLSSIIVPVAPAKEFGGSDILVYVSLNVSYLYRYVLLELLPHDI